METLKRMKLKFCRPGVLLILFGLLAGSARAGWPPGYTTNNIAYTNLNYWTFDNPTNFLCSGRGYLPGAATNLFTSDLGDGNALGIDVPGFSAFYEMPLTNYDGTSNLALNAGSVILWYAPAWSSTNQGGAGPGTNANLLTVGGYTPDSSFGYFALYIDAGGQNICLCAQTNDFSSNLCVYLTAPISWSTDYWHCVCLNYGPSGTAIFLDGLLATNGPPLTNYPGENVFANGLYWGSDSNGLAQAQGLLDDIFTYPTPLDSVTIADLYYYYSFPFRANPLNPANGLADIVSAGSIPSTNLVDPDAITGSGYLQWTSYASFCSTNINPWFVWLTNLVVTARSATSETVQFTVEGGAEDSDAVFDVFANSALGFGTNSPPWAWLGQVSPCNRYQVAGLPTNACFLILGTPYASTNSELTDAYQLLVSHTNPKVLDSDLDGILTGWEVLLGLNPFNSNLTDASKRSNYGYTPADWFNMVSGIKSGTNTLDNEGNLTSVSQ